VCQFGAKGDGVAGVRYRPSYLSGLWALGFHDLIPERVVRFTSLSPRSPQCVAAFDQIATEVAKD
jgi:hypothetical protein